jgi:hypothetical protein
MVTNTPSVAMGRSQLSARVAGLADRYFGVGPKRFHQSLNVATISRHKY